MSTRQRLSFFKDRLQDIDQEIEASTRKLESLRAHQMTPTASLRASRVMISPGSYSQVFSKENTGPSKPPFFGGSSRKKTSEDTEPGSVLSSLYMEVDRSINNEKALELQGLEASFKQKEEQIKSAIFAEEMLHKETISKIKSDYMRKKDEQKRQYKFYVTSMKKRAQEALDEENKRVNSFTLKITLKQFARKMKDLMSFKPSQIQRPLRTWTTAERLYSTPEYNPERNLTFSQESVKKENIQALVKSQVAQKYMSFDYSFEG